MQKSKYLDAEVKSPVSPFYESKYMAGESVAAEPLKPEPQGVVAAVGDHLARGAVKYGVLPVAGIAQIAGDVTGIDSLSKYGREGDEGAEMWLADQEKANPSQKFQDIRSIGDVGQWAGEQLTEFAPQIGVSLLTGGVGAALGKTVAQGAVKTGLADIGTIAGEKLLTKAVANKAGQALTANEIKSLAMQRAGEAGFIGATGAGSIGMETATIYQGQDEDKKDAGKAALYGTAAGILDSVLPAYLIKKTGLAKIVPGMGTGAREAEALLAKPALTAGQKFANTGKIATLGTGEETVQEGVQTVLENIGSNKQVYSDEVVKGGNDFNSFLKIAGEKGIRAAVHPDAWSDIVESMAVGGLIGGAMGGGAAGVGHVLSPSAQQEQPATEPVTSPIEQTPEERVQAAKQAGAGPMTASLQAFNPAPEAAPILSDSVPVEIPFTPHPVDADITAMAQSRLAELQANQLPDDQPSAELSFLESNLENIPALTQAYGLDRSGLMAEFDAANPPAPVKSPEEITRDEAFTWRESNLAAMPQLLKMNGEDKRSYEQRLVAEYLKNREAPTNEVSTVPEAGSEGETKLPNLRDSSKEALAEILGGVGEFGKSSELVDGHSSFTNSTTHGVDRGAESFSRIIGSESFSKHGFSGLDVKGKGIVVSGVVNAAQDSEVLDSIVSLLPVDVMNNLRSRQLTPEMLFHNESMLKDAFTGNHNSNISFSRQTADSIMRAAALATTKNEPVLSDRGNISLEGNSAYGTNKGNHNNSPIESLTNIQPDEVIKQELLQVRNALAGKRGNEVLDYLNKNVPSRLLLEQSGVFDESATNMTKMAQQAFKWANSGLGTRDSVLVEKPDQSPVTSTESRTSDPVQQRLDAVTEDDRGFLDRVRSMVDGWTKGGRYNGPSNKTEIMPFLKSWGKTTPAEVAQAITNFLEGKKLGDVQRLLVDDALSEDRTLPQYAPADTSFDTKEFNSTLNTQNSTLLKKAALYAGKVGDDVALLDSLSDGEIQAYVNGYERWAKSQSRGAAPVQSIGSLINERRQAHPLPAPKLAEFKTVVAPKREKGFATIGEMVAASRKGRTTTIAGNTGIAPTVPTKPTEPQANKRVKPNRLRDARIRFLEGQRRLDGKQRAELGRLKELAGAVMSAPEKPGNEPTVANIEPKSEPRDYTDEEIAALPEVKIDHPVLAVLKESAAKAEKSLTQKVNETADVSPVAETEKPANENGAGEVATPTEAKDFGANNKVFTREKADAARALLKSKQGQLNSGLDPEMVAAGLDLSGYYIEAGFRSFAEYSHKMLADLGEVVKPYLKSWYMAVKHHPGFDSTGMEAEADIANQEPALIERRQDDSKRKELDAMSPEELRAELFIDPLTGLGNSRAYEAVSRKPFQAIIDIDSLKWVNDHLGYDKGDELIRKVGAAIRKETTQGFHLHGDEFAVHAESLDTLEKIIITVAKALESETISGELDGKSVVKTGLGVSYGVGETMAAATSAMQKHKTEREGSGARSGRGEMPGGIVEKLLTPEVNKTPAKTKAVADAGEELIYNKRNRIKGIKWDDIKDSPDALKAENAQKGKVYEKPDYAALVEDGMPDLVAHLVKQVYDALPNAPVTTRTPTDADFQTYITAVNRVMDATLQWAQDREAVATWAAKQGKFAGASMGTVTSISDMLAKVKTPYDVAYPDGWRAFKDEVHILGGNKILSRLQPGYDEVRRGIKDVEKGWPGKTTAWARQGYSISSKDGMTIKAVRQNDGSDYFTVRLKDRPLDGFQSQAEADAYVAGLKPFLLVKKGYRIVDSFATQAEAEEGAKKLVTKEQKSTPDERGVNVADAKREGPVRRLEGENVTAQRIMDEFGFRGINIGNWVPADEAQLHLNFIYDSLLDVAELFNLPPKALSLNNTLGIAVGAQGGGKASAHYVPAYKEINITRTSGAGAFIHEWLGHGLDNYFGELAGWATDKKAYLSKHLANNTTGEVRPEVVAAFKKIMSVMAKRQETLEEVAERIKQSSEAIEKAFDKEVKRLAAIFETAPEEAQAEVARLLQKLKDHDFGDGYVSISSSKVVQPIVADLYQLAKKYKIAPKYSGTLKPDDFTYLDYIARSVKRTAETEQQNEEHTPLRLVDTDFLAASKEADKGKSAAKLYWSTPWELFARAVDAYVTDKIAAQGQSNSYLSGLEAIAPQGEERKTINQAFDVLFGSLKTKETEKGTALYSAQNEAGFSASGLDGDTVTAKPLSQIGGLSIFDTKTLREESAKAGRQFTPVEVTGEKSDTLRQIAKTFGMRVVFFSENTDTDKIRAGQTGTDSANESADKARPFIDGFIRPDHSRTIFLNTASSRHLFQIIGHELMHSLALNKPQEYVQMANALLPYIDNAKYEAYRNRLEEIAVYKGADQLKLYNEFVANLSGELFTKENIWATLAKEQPTLFEKLATAVVKILKKITGLFVDADQAQDVLRDAATANRIIVNALKAYAADHGAENLNKDLQEALYSATTETQSGPFIPVSDKTPDSFALAPRTGSTKASQVQRVVDSLTANWKNAPIIKVVQSVEELPNSPLKSVLASKVQDSVRGIFDKGTIYLVADNIGSRQEALKVLLHETVGHYGIRGLVGNRVNMILQHAYVAFAKDGGLQEIAKRYKLDLTQFADRLTAAEEKLAEIAESGESPTLYDKFVVAIRNALRLLKFNLDLSDADIRVMIAAAKGWVERGKGSSYFDGVRFMTAWHGSPHDHDGFDMSKVGTGEGAQAYGYGLYMAGNKEVAEYYKNSLSPFVSTYDGEILPFSISDMSHPLVKAAKELIGENKYLLHLVNDAIIDIGALDNEGIKHLVETPEGDYQAREGQLVKLFQKMGVVTERKGKLYQVELAPSADEYLLWDKPLSEQSEKVQGILKDAGYHADFGFDYIDGKSFYKSLSERKAFEGAGFQRINDQAASEYLHSLGIRGIKYLDGSSRGGSDMLVDGQAVDYKDPFHSLSLAVYTSGGDMQAARQRLENGLTVEIGSVAETSRKALKLLDEGVKPGKVTDTANYNYVIFSDTDIEITAKFALAEAVDYGKSVWNDTSGKGLLDGLARLANPFDWSRSRQWFEHLAPEYVKQGMGWLFANPVFQAERDPLKRPFVEAGIEREETRIGYLLAFRGWDGSVKDTTLLGRFKDTYSKWQNADASTAWGKIQDANSRLSNQQQEAVNVLLWQGDVRSKSYKSLEDAVKWNKVIAAVKPSAEAFKIYLSVRHHMDTVVAKERERIFKEMSREAGLSEEETNRHISDYRNELAKRPGWLPRNHGEGSHQANVYHVIKELKFETKKVETDGHGEDSKQAFLPYYAGPEVTTALEKIVKGINEKYKADKDKEKRVRFGSVINGEVLLPNGQMVVTGKTADIDAFLKEAAAVVGQVQAKAEERLANLKEARDLAEENGGTKQELKELERDIAAATDTRILVKTFMKLHESEAGAAKTVTLLKKDLKAEMSVNYREGEEYEVKQKFADAMTESAFGDLSGDFAMERAQMTALKRATQSGEISKEEAKTMRQAIIKSSAEVLMGRGAGRHQISRAPYLIEGYEKDSAIQAYDDYMSSTAGMLSKAQYAREQFENFRHAPSQVKLWAEQYIRDTLRNMGAADQVSGNARMVASFWFLGFKASSMLVNATQVWTLGVAELGRRTKQNSVKAIGRAQADIMKGRLTKEEKELFNSKIWKLQEMETVVNEMTGAEAGATGKISEFMHTLTAKAMMPFQEMELFNRRTMILAAYRSALADGMKPEAAVDFAMDVNRNTNFEMSRANVPGWARGPAGRTAYALQSFVWNNWNWIYNRATSGEKADMVALLKYSGMIALIGGAAALAGGDEADKIYRRLFGRSIKLDLQNFTRKHAKEYGTPGELLNAFIWHGGMGVLGVNISNSMRLNVPLSGFVTGQTTASEAALGVFAGLASKAGRAGSYAMKGEVGKALEAAAPAAIEAPLRAYRMATEGATTSHGKPVYDENGRQLKYSKGEAAVRAFGFQPLEQSKRSEVSQQQRVLQAYWNEKRQEAIDEFRRDRKLKVIVEFNKSLRESQALGPVKYIKDLGSILKSKPNKGQMGFMQENLK